MGYLLDFSVFLLDASWDSDTPVLFFMDYGRFFGTRGLEKRECNRCVLIRAWMCEWIYRLGCCEVQHLCMQWFDLIAFDQIMTAGRDILLVTLPWFPGCGWKEYSAWWGFWMESVLGS